jgi:hypothetical protein
MERSHMRIASLAKLGLGCFLVASTTVAKADEFAFSSYGLGGAAFGAGVTPPPGTYVSFVSGFYAGDIGGSITIGGVVFNAGAKVEFFQAALNGLHVLQNKVWGGHLGVGVTVPVGHIDIAANVVAGPVTTTRQTDGWGLGDVTARIQLGWERGDFSHLVYVQGVAPTGRYQNGFAPNIGLNRPGIDTGWAFTYADKKTKWQINGAVGVTFNFENDETDYRSGTDLHFEWAIGREIATGLVVGVVGYDYRQLSGDSGPGAVLGPFRGDVDAVGAGLSYTTLIGKTPLILGLRHYQEFNAEHRWDGHMTIFTGTVRF